MKEGISKDDAEALKNLWKKLALKLKSNKPTLPVAA
ncbi:hypothetical protein DMH17_12270 [Raoultella planticola]|nr:hypothetical protein [Raoultella planticola]